jgi:hypothetical protein
MLLEHSRILKFGHLSCRMVKRASYRRQKLSGLETVHGLFGIQFDEMDYV